MWESLASLIYERSVRCLGVGVRCAAQTVYFAVNQVIQATSVWTVCVYVCAPVFEALFLVGGCVRPHCDNVKA